MTAFWRPAFDPRYYDRGNGTSNTTSNTTSSDDKRPPDDKYENKTLQITERRRSANN